MDIDDDDDDDDDVESDPTPPKIPRLDAFWEWKKCNNEQIQPAQLPVNQSESILVDMPDNPTPYDFFKLYVTDDLLDMIVRETNRYAAQFIADNIGSLKPHSLVHQWRC